MVTTVTAARAADGAEPGSNPVAALLRSRAGDHRPAYREGLTGRALSWADLAGRAGQWSDVLLEAAAGVAEPDGASGSASAAVRGVAGAVPRAGLLLGDPLELAAAYLGGLAAGVTVAPLDPDATPSELAAKTATLGLTSILLEAGQAARHDGWAGPHLELWEAGPSRPDQPERPRLARRREAAPGATVGDAALLLASSGTTGAPKVIPLGVDQLLRTARSVVQAHRLGPDDRGYSPLPLHHINGLVVGVLAALVGGYELTVDRWFSASRFWDVAGASEVTWVNLVPAILGVLAHRDAPSPDVAARVRFARSASAPLARATLRAFEVRTGILVVETYGLTEAGSQVTANPPTGPERRTGSVGVPVGVDLRVVDDRRAPLRPGAVGQVEIRGPSVVASYWAPAGSDPPARPATDAEGWLATGDLGWVDGDGYVWLVGRVDDVINRGGEKIYPREIEEILLAEPGVADAAVVGRPDPLVGEVPVAFVRARAVGDATSHEQLATQLAERLVARCERELSRRRRPVDIFVTDELPTGTNGKIRRSELRRALAPG